MAITLKHVTKELNGRKVLNDISLDFEYGHIYGLRGYNGSGKTMLLRVLCGIMYPTEGQVLCDGKELGRDIDFPESVGLLIENPAFIGSLSAAGNLELILSLRPELDTKERIDDALSRVGLGDTGKLRYSRFSLGMKQRLGIAAAIMEDPRLLLLDEPTNALDEDGIGMVTELVRGMKSPDRIIVVASHEKEFLNSLADKIIEMREGRIQTDGK
jgi:ABC-2 type transport system ATP-binding protein